jgi:ribosomal protein L35
MTKPKKTLLKRIKITKNGKILKKQTRTGHLMRKMSASRRSRKMKMTEQENSGHKKVIKRLLSGHGKRI